MLAYANRFHGHSSLRYVFKNGDTLRARALTLRLTKNSHRSTSRFSVSVSKKVLKSAVKRNRVRRRIYEVIRHSLADMTGTYDVVLIVTAADILSAEHKVLEEAVLKALGDAGLIGRVPATPDL